MAPAVCHEMNLENLLDIRNWSVTYNLWLVSWEVIGLHGREKLHCYGLAVGCEIGYEDSNLKALQCNHIPTVHCEVVIRVPTTWWPLQYYLPAVSHDDVYSDHSEIMSSLPLTSYSRPWECVSKWPCGNIAAPLTSYYQHMRCDDSSWWHIITNFLLIIECCDQIPAKKVQLQLCYPQSIDHGKRYDQIAWMRNVAMLLTHC